MTMPRVVFFTFDRLHTGYLGCYGNDWIETPHLDRLAAEGVVFDEAFADELAPTLAGESWWRLPDAEDVCQFLHARGVHTICLYESDPVDSSRRLPRCETLVPVPVDDTEGSREAETSWGRFGEAVARWVGEHGLPDDCFLWLHSRGIPEPWYPPAEYQDLYFPEFGLADDDEHPEAPQEVEEDSRSDDPTDEPTDEPLDEAGEEVVLDNGVCDEPEIGDPDEELQRRLGRALYAACATAVDRMVGRTIAALKAAGVWDECLIVVTAARGQALGEHVPMGVDPDLPHAELTHVPLIVRGPNRDWPGTRRRELVQPADVREFLLDQFRNGGDSASRMSTILGDFATGSLDTPDETGTRAVTGWLDRGWMIRDRYAAYLCPAPIPDHPDIATARLYALPADRHEFADILGQATEEARTLWDELRSREGGEPDNRSRLGTYPKTL